MPAPRFLQIHTLHSYPGTLLNRDQHGYAKRLLFGGHVRLRISSQCLKRHWRTAEGPHSLHSIEGATEAVRSRRTVERSIMGPLRDSQEYSPEFMDAVEEALHKAVYGSSGTEERSRQPLLLGLPEINHIANLATQLCQDHRDSAEDAVNAINLLFSERHGQGANFKGMLDNTRLPAGIETPLFGRMLTSDPRANVDSAIHVAHAISVHEIESEEDYLTVVDDLQNRNEPGAAAHLAHTELTSGLYYGYVVVDVPLLVSNLEACPPEDWEKADTALAKDALRSLINTIATVTPGAKLGSTAPYTYAEFIMVEAGYHPPRTLMNAFRKPVDSVQTEDAITALNNYAQRVDDRYGKHEERRFMSLTDNEMAAASPLNTDDLADWATEALTEARQEA